MAPAARLRPRSQSRAFSTFSDRQDDAGQAEHARRLQQRTELDEKDRRARELRPQVRSGAGRGRSSLDPPRSAFGLWEGRLPATTRGDTDLPIDRLARLAASPRLRRPTCPPPQGCVKCEKKRLRKGDHIFVPTEQGRVYHHAIVLDEPDERSHSFRLIHYLTTGVCVTSSAEDSRFLARAWVWLLPRANYCAPPPRASPWASSSCCALPRA